jgi:hypothetical protein
MSSTIIRPLDSATLWCATLLFAALLALVIARRKFQRARAAKIHMQHQAIDAFFADTNNLTDASIDKIFAATGSVPLADDWDWGRLVYEWRTSHARYRVVSRGGYVISVEKLDPNDQSRFGKTIQTLWQSGNN